MANDYDYTTVVTEVLQHVPESAVPKVVEIVINQVAMYGTPKHFAQNCYNAIESCLRERGCSLDCMPKCDVFVAEALISYRVNYNKDHQALIAGDLMRSADPELCTEVAAAILRSATSLDVYDILQRILSSPTAAPQLSNGGGMLALSM